MKKKDFVRPTRDQVAEELRRERYKRRYRSAVTSTVYTLITVAAAAVLVATLLLPVLRIYGTSMTPTLDNGQIVVSVKTGELEPGDVVAFYYNNKILIKRVILNCTPFVRQYGILSNKWGVLLCQREYRTNDTQRNSRSW